MATSKSKLIYKILTIITLGAPLPIYLFLSATLFNIVPDYEIRNITSESVLVETVDEYTFVYTNDTTAILHGAVVQYEGEYGFYMDEDDILKLDNGYFNSKLEDIKTLEVNKQLSYKLPLTFFISLFGVGIVALIVSGKLQWHKKYPRTAVLIALTTGTVILLILDTFISSILGVFVVATASWAVYCLEYMVHENQLTQAQADKSESDVLTALKEALRE